MCGILCSTENQNSFFERLNIIRHRGPDDQQIINIDNLNFGFTRLSINDKTEKGMQPFKYKHFIGLFNGEIYNFRELIYKYNLKTQSKSDTEIILLLFDKLNNKSEIIDILDGFFSGVIFDTQNKKFYFLRDHIGKKPLFFVKTEDKNIFITSELKTVSDKKIESFQLLPKGFSELKNNKINHIKYIFTDFKLKHNFLNILENAVKKRVPNEKFGVFLSGGIDSSVIAFLSLKFSQNIIFYTLGDKLSEDYKSVQILIKFLKIKNIKFVDLPIDSKIEELINKVVFHTESYNPSIISNGIGTYLLSKQAKKDNLKVVLTGDGADEVFCGYDICKTEKDIFKKREQFLNDLETTELRRIDLSAMANSIELRNPFLDKNLVFYKYSKDDLFNKNILRKTFQNLLPHQIVERNKKSFDRGSSLRSSVVNYLRRNNNSEKFELLKIWKSKFILFDENHSFFHSYPVFDKYIENRAVK
jgi:asparagine synthase (glutamine-hydrolysing)